MMGAMQDICPSEHKNDNIHIRCLHDACKLLGGERHLAAYLGVPVEDVEMWLTGRGQPPDWVFLRCTDIIATLGGRSPA